MRAMVAARNVRRIVFHVSRATSEALYASSALLQTLKTHGFLLDVSVRDSLTQKPVMEAVAGLPVSTGPLVSKTETLHVVEADDEAKISSPVQNDERLIVEMSSDSLRNTSSVEHLAASLLGLESAPSLGVRLFGAHLVSQSQVFYETELSFCLVNLKPIVPGHVLVLPKRCVDRFEHLDVDEVGDLWSTAQRVGAVIQRHYQASSLTFAIQDGPEAGQTVKHVHIHVLPRRKLDFKVNDDVYNEIEAHDRRLGMDNEDRRPRSLEMMAAEAAALRELFI